MGGRVDAMELMMKHNGSALDSVTLLTGASGGLGQAIVKELIAAGCKNIACQYRSNSSAIRNVLETSGLDPDRHLFHADLLDESSVAQLREQINIKLGPVINLINLAGASSNSMSWKTSTAEFEAIIAANLTTTFLCCREFTPSMREHRFGRIINISSIVANKGVIGAAHYAAAKAAISGYSRSLALELANRNICVNTLALGYMDAGIIDQVPEEIQAELIQQTPVKRLGSAKDISDSICYLLSEGGSFITGQELHINGGLFL